MSGNVHPNPGPVFPCSVCAGNVTWSVRSVLCWTCSKWVHLRCSLLSSKFKTLGSSHSWTCFFGCVPASRNPTTSNSVSSSSDSSSLYTSTVLSGPFGSPLLMQHFRPTLAFKPFILLSPISHLFPLHLHHRLMLLAVFLYLQLPLPPDSLRVLQWNAGGLHARRTELLHLSRLTLLIQESNVNSSSPLSGSWILCSSI